MDRLVSKYTDLSAIADEFNVPTLGSSLNYLSANLEVHLNKSLFKYQKICTVCGIELKEGLTLKKNMKKKHCKYCYTAVCVNCSPFKVKSQLNEKQQRVCIACFSLTLKDYFRMTVGPRPESPGIERMKNDKDYLEIIKNEIRRRKSEVEEFDKEIQKEIKVSSFKENEQSDLMKTVRSLEENLLKENEELDYLGKVHKSNVKKIKKLKQQINENKSLIETKLSFHSSSLAIGWSRDSVTDILQNQIAMNTGLRNVLLHDTEKMKRDAPKNSTRSCILF